LFSRIFGFKFDEFPRKARSAWEIKSLRRSSSGGVTLFKKCERDPRSGLAGRTKVKTFESFRKIF
jgi:hypothetical protein